MTEQGKQTDFFYYYIILGLPRAFSSSKPLHPPRQGKHQEDVTRQGLQPQHPLHVAGDPARGPAGLHNAVPGRREAAGLAGVRQPPA